jgi:hypothetical protein
MLRYRNGEMGNRLLIVEVNYVGELASVSAMFMQSCNEMQFQALIDSSYHSCTGFDQARCLLPVLPALAHTYSTDGASSGCPRSSTPTAGASSGCPRSSTPTASGLMNWPRILRGLTYLCCLAVPEGTPVQQVREEHYLPQTNNQNLGA